MRAQFFLFKCFSYKSSIIIAAFVEIWVEAIKNFRYMNFIF